MRQMGKKEVGGKKEGQIGLAFLKAFALTGLVYLRYVSGIGAGKTKLHERRVAVRQVIGSCGMTGCWVNPPDLLTHYQGCFCR